MQGTTNPAPCCDVAKSQNSNFITFSVATWQRTGAAINVTLQIYCGCVDDDDVDDTNDCYIWF